MVHEEARPPTNMRRFRKKSDRNALILVIFTLVVVGGGLIAWALEPVALLTALPCLLGGAVILVMLWLLLTLLELWRTPQ
ncbi:hypothetical protein KFU94_25710 [Chloroflexi bacterium TSY]|nr:hypothetical protein [Chloroflexi bacterium TSY]